MRSLLLGLMVFLGCSSFLNAQLVNIEKSRKDPKDGFQGLIGVDISLTKNTRQILETGTVTQVQYHKNRHTVLLLNNLRFMRVEDDDLINNGFQHLRYNYLLRDSVTIFEVFTQHQYNSIRLLQRRFLLGVGPRFRIFDTGRFDLYLAPLVMFEHERFNDEQNTQTDKFKGDFYISTSYEIEERITFSHTTYYQPDFNKIDQFRVASETGFEFTVNEVFSFVATFDLAYDSHPRGDIPELFYTLKNGIKYEF